MVSRSRISPTRMTSGFWRRADLSADGKVDRVVADLALVDEAQPVGVLVLDRVFDGDDVRLAGAVDVVDHRRQRGALAAAGGAGDQDEAAPLGGQAFDRPGAG